MGYALAAEALRNLEDKIRDTDKELGNNKVITDLWEIGLQSNPISISKIARVR